MSGEMRVASSSGEFPTQKEQAVIHKQELPVS
jgi:hypothetical protein